MEAGPSTVDRTEDEFAYFFDRVEPSPGQDWFATDSGYSSLQNTQTSLADDPDMLLGSPLDIDPFSFIPDPSIYCSAEPHEPVLECVPEADYETITGLIDAVLRLTIQEKAHNRAKGIEVVRSDFKQKLHEVAPAMWKPGYLQVKKLLHLSSLHDTDLDVGNIHTCSVGAKNQSHVLTIAVCKCPISVTQEEAGKACGVPPGRCRRRNRL